MVCKKDRASLCVSSYRGTEKGYQLLSVSRQSGARTICSSTSLTDAMFDQYHKSDLFRFLCIQNNHNISALKSHHACVLSVPVSHSMVFTCACVCACVCVTDTYIGGLSDQPLLCVEDVLDASDQLQRTAVIRALKDKARMCPVSPVSRVSR